MSELFAAATWFMVNTCSTESGIWKHARQKVSMGCVIAEVPAYSQQVWQHQAGQIDIKLTMGTVENPRRHLHDGPKLEATRCPWLAGEECVSTPGTATQR